jgi:ParB family chromosome partitioning protein
VNLYIEFLLTEFKLNAYDSPIYPRKNLKINNLIHGMYSPRLKKDDAYIDKLAKSIEENGLINCIIVVPHPSLDSTFLIVDGEHRVEAYKKLGFSQIPAEVRSLDDREANLLAVRVNLHDEKQLNCFEEGLAFEKLIRLGGLTQRELAQKTNKSQQYISSRLVIAKKSSAELIQAVTTRVVKVGHARLIAKLPKNIQKIFLIKVITEDLTYRETNFFVDALLKHPDYSYEFIDKASLDMIGPPEDIFKTRDDVDWSFSQFHVGNCPQCKKEYYISWALRIMSWAFPINKINYEGQNS